MGFDILNSLLLDVKMQSCDDLVSGANITYTYVNEALRASSRIDYFFVTNQLMSGINSVFVIDNSSCSNSDQPY